MVDLNSQYLYKRGAIGGPMKRILSRLILCTLVLSTSGFAHAGAKEVELQRLLVQATQLKTAIASRTSQQVHESARTEQSEAKASAGGSSIHQGVFNETVGVTWAKGEANSQRFFLPFTKTAM